MDTDSDTDTDLDTDTDGQYSFFYFDLIRFCSSFDNACLIYWLLSHGGLGDS